MQSTPQTGDVAPDATIKLTDGHLVTLANRWRQSRTGLALVFLRHYGCPFCKEHAEAINERREVFANAGIDVLLIGCGTLEEAIAFHRTLDLTIPLGNDPERTAYRAYGLGSAPLPTLAHPRVIAGGVRAAIKGHLPQKSSGHPLQLQGQFLIDPAGIIRIADRPVLMSEISGADVLLSDANALLATQ